MSVKEIKETLLKEIEASDDEWTLQEMYDLLHRRRQPEAEERNGSVYKLSDAQRAAIREGQDAFARGDYMTDEEAEADLDQFFKEEDAKWGEK